MIALAVVLAILVRQLFILAAIVRSRSFLAAAPPPAHLATETPALFVVVPVLRESSIIAETIEHMVRLTDGHRARVVIVTTEREATEPSPGGDTATMVKELATTGTFTHLHYPDPRGLKGDQVNFAAAHCASTLLGGGSPAEAYVVCYDADSRPPLDALIRFEAAIAANGEASVFHQSARFELRGPTGPEVGALGSLAQAVCDGGALRANRFVLGFEIPRLVNRSGEVGQLKRAACSYVYAHVTGHGLCVRLSFLLDHPLPAGSPLEDMQYSFHLGSHDILMVPVAGLDHAAVPDTITAQVRQASRWFFGPARAVRYLRDPSTGPGVRGKLQAASALGSAGEWLGCAVVVPAILAALFLARGPLQLAAAAVAATYLVQLLATDLALGTPGAPRRRATRVLACPLAHVLFGIGGFIGAVNLLRGDSGIGKTERR
ncbi:glycosyltransferase family 2 protein [Micromonospora sp. NPDC047465]|uniref:glycosyltransferase family 2 protein n=1 Tax=Micromonospora sp. NPDC047465 TaxID=3154813 RepID=UPI0033FA7FAB